MENKKQKNEEFSLAQKQDEARKQPIRAWVKENYGNDQHADLFEATKVYRRKIENSVLTAIQDGEIALVGFAEFIGIVLIGLNGEASNLFLPFSLAGIVATVAALKAVISLATQNEMTPERDAIYLEFEDSGFRDEYPHAVYTHDELVLELYKAIKTVEENMNEGIKKIKNDEINSGVESPPDDVQITLEDYRNRKRK